MKILVDMNLSPEWVTALHSHGWSAVHWSQVGYPRASDESVMEWARSHGYVVFTHDLDFGALLAATQAGGPSVIQVRAQDVMPSRLAARFDQVLRRHQNQIDGGAIITVDEAQSRVRILPLRRQA